MTTKVNLTDLSFDGIKRSLKDFLKGQDEFKDYNFEGSGLNVLLDLLAYNSQNNAYLANMLANESEIDSAILRSSVVSRAKLLGYTPKSTTAARAVISLTVEEPSKTQSSLVLPRGTRFIVKSNNQQFVFLTLKEYNLPVIRQGVFQHKEIEVFEGSLKAYSFDVTSHERRYVIPSTTIDTATLQVVVYDSETANTYEVYERAHTIQKIKKDSAAFWVYETDNGRYEIKFGDGVFGKLPTLDGIVYCEYLESNGPAANDFSKFSLVGTFAGFESATITVETVAASAGGADPEATSSIKINAPRFFQSQNRAVTKEDYVAIANDVYPYAKSIAAWGGEEATPVQFGKVFVSIIPRSTTLLTTANKKEIEKKIKERGIIGITPKVVDPKYLNLNATVRATVNGRAVNGLGNFSNQLRVLVTDYFNSEFGIFDADFRYSRLVNKLMNHSRAVIAVRIDFTLSIKDRFLRENSELSYGFENALIPNTITGSRVKLAGATEWQVIKDDNGKLYVNTTEVGSVNYTTGLVTVSNEKLSEIEGDILEVFATPVNDDVDTGFRTAIVLNESRLSVEVQTL